MRPSKAEKAGHAVVEDGWFLPLCCLSWAVEGSEVGKNALGRRGSA